METVSFITEKGEESEHSNQIHRETYFQRPDHVLVIIYI